MFGSHGSKACSAMATAWKVALTSSVLLSFAASVLGAVPYSEDVLPGLQGERARLVADSNLRDDAVLRRERDTGIDPFRVTQVSSEPRAFVYSKFLTDEECDHLVELARSHMVESMVANSTSGQAMKSTVRTSSGTFLMTKDEVVERIEKRIAAWTFLPAENGEAIQVLRYEDGEKYDAHFDYFHDKVNTQLGGHRYATVLMYLTDVDQGGETVFPHAKIPAGSSFLGSTSPCARQGIAVVPRKGDALLFYSLHLDGTSDDHSLHAGCPVLRGEKWSATKWIHAASFETRPVGGACEDLNPSCEKWAAKGECTRNPAYMVGNDKVAGSCRKACKKC